MHTLGIQGAAFPADKIAATIGTAIPDVLALYVFGSAAEERLRADSDLDLAVLAVNPIDSVQIFELAQSCARQVGREIDLVDLRAVPLILQAQIVGRGRRIFVAGVTSEADCFENQVLSRYAAFAEERRVVIDEIVKRRAIHAA